MDIFLSAVMDVSRNGAEPSLFIRQSGGMVRNECARVDSRGKSCLHVISFAGPTLLALVPTLILFVTIYYKLVIDRRRCTADR